MESTVSATSAESVGLGVTLTEGSGTLGLKIVERILEIIACKEFQWRFLLRTFVV